MLYFVNGILKRIASTKGAFEEYQQTKEKKVLALKKLMYAILTIWHLHIIVTVSITLYGLYLIRQYLLTLMALIGFLYLQYGKRPQQPPINPIERYLQVKDFIFEPIRLISESLPVYKPQCINDIVHKPEYLIYNGHTLFIYKLLKNINEELVHEDVKFIQKLLQARINQNLEEYQQSFGYPTWYKDVRIITVNDIKDLGTHYQISIIYVDNDFAYDYVISKLNPRASTSSSDHYDDLF